MMPRTSLSTLFISDIHLSQRQARHDRRPGALFLAEEAPGADALYVLGICSNSGLATTTPTRSTARWLRCLPRPEQAERACLLYPRQPRLLGRQFARRAGMTLLGDPCVIELYGEQGAAEPRRSALHPG